MAGARGPARRKLVGRLLGPRNRRRGAGPERLLPPPAMLARGLGAVLGLVLLALAWPLVRDAVVTHPYFAVREVVVRGNRRLPSDALRTAAGVEPGMSIWAIDCAAAEEQLRREPWVRRARVQRQLPHRVVIQVREERPTAILATEAASGPPRYYYVTARGRVVAPVAPGDGRDFPYLTGLTPADLADGEPFGPHALRQALRLVRAAGRPGAVSEVHVDRTRGLTLLPVTPPVPIAVGWGRYAEKLGRLRPVMAQWTGREADMAGISLLFNDEVIVQTKATKPVKRVPARRPAAKV